MPDSAAATSEAAQPVQLADTRWTSSQVAAFMLALGGILAAIVGAWLGLHDQVRDSQAQIANAQTRIAAVEGKVDALLIQNGINPATVPSAAPRNTPTPTRITP